MLFHVFTVGRKICPSMTVSICLLFRATVFRRTRRTLSLHHRNAPSPKFFQFSDTIMGVVCLVKVKTCTKGFGV